MKKLMFLVMLISLLSLLNAASFYTLKDGKGDVGFEGSFKGGKMHSRVDKENLINKDEDDIVGYLYYNYFNEGIDIHLEDLNFYKDNKTGNIHFWFEAYTHSQGRKRKNDDSTYILSPYTYAKFIVFPMTVPKKKTDSWTTQRSAIKKVGKMSKLTNIEINRNQYGNRWIDGILPDENIYYSINTYLPKDKMPTIEILLLKSDNIFKLLQYLNNDCRNGFLSVLEFPQSAQNKYKQEVKKLYNAIDKLKQDEFETSSDFELRMKKANEVRYQKDKELSVQLEGWIEDDKQQIVSSEEEIEIKDYSLGYYNVDEMKLPITILGLKGYILIAPEKARTLKTKLEGIIIKGVRKMNLDMKSYNYSNIVIKHQELDEEFDFEQ